jgi:ABC-type transport system involved in multi-copper enzyme maturation permease subunit
MIRQIICKEVLENLLSLRYILSLLLIISLFVISGFAFVHKYEQQSQDYWQATNKNLSTFSGRSSELYRLAFYKQQIWRKPKPLALCAEGFEKYLPNYFVVNIFSTGYPEVKGKSNLDLARFSDIDWVFIISLILSFVALIFTYDCICGEKQAGTLRLMLAASIPRHKILLGKYFGVMLTVGIPLAIGLLLNLIIVTVSKNIALNTGEWLKIFVIVLLSFLYLSIFVLLGTFVSSRTAYSANCMVILLLMWAALVILIPSFGRIISDVSGKSPTRTEYQKRLLEVEKQMMDDLLAGKYGMKAGSMVSDDPHDPRQDPPARARWKNMWADAKNQVLEDLLNRMVAKADSGRHLTCISPTIPYQRACEAIAVTGINQFKSLYQQIKRYQENLKEYVRGKDAEDPDSLHLVSDEEYAAKRWGTVSKKPVDFDTVPKFQERDPKLSESLELAIWDIGLLVLFNLVFFTAAYVSFLRYDVR